MAAREDVTTPTNLDQLLELVKVNSADEQEINQKREAEFNAKVNQQDAILKSEQRELARQERIADQLEEKWKKNDKELRVAEEKYIHQLGSLRDVF